MTIKPDFNISDKIRYEALSPEDKLEAHKLADKKLRNEILTAIIGILLVFFIGFIGSWIH